jgi:hypothetical protein
MDSVASAHPGIGHGYLGGATWLASVPQEFISKQDEVQITEIVLIFGVRF